MAQISEHVQLTSAYCFRTKQKHHCQLWTASSASARRDYNGRRPSTRFLSKTSYVTKKTMDTKMVKMIVTILSATAHHKILRKHWPWISCEPCNPTDVFSMLTFCEQLTPGTSTWRQTSKLVGPLTCQGILTSGSLSLQNTMPPRCIKYFGKTPTCKNRKSGNRSPLAKIRKMSERWFVNEVPRMCL